MASMSLGNVGCCRLRGRRKTSPENGHWRTTWSLSLNRIERQNTWCTRMKEEKEKSGYKRPVYEGK